MFAAMKRSFKSGLVPSNYPTDAWLDKAAEHLKYSPDYRALEGFESILLFVCDEMQAGHKCEQVLTHSQYDDVAAMHLAPAFTKSDFSFWKKSLGKESYPVPLEGIKQYVPEWKHTNKLLKNIPKAQLVDLEPRSIRGELFAVRPYKLLELDKYKENGVVFQRNRIQVDIPYLYRVSNAYATSQFVYKCTSLEAFMYVGVKDYWKDFLDAGFQFNLVSMVKNEMNVSAGYTPHDFVKFPYYHFNLNEYKL